MTDRGDIDDGNRPAGAALVPLSRPGPTSSPAGRIARPDSGFVAHLIATAAQVPQTCRLRRAAPADAHSAYTASLRPPLRAGDRTRQSV
jgi:hypothetical protein